MASKELTNPLKVISQKLSKTNLDKLKESILLQSEILAQTGNSVDVEYGPRREGDAAKTDANISKAIDTLGWEPIYSIEDIVKTEIEYQNFKKK